MASSIYTLPRFKEYLEARRIITQQKEQICNSRLDDWRKLACDDENVSTEARQSALACAHTINEKIDYYSQKLYYYYEFSRYIHDLFDNRPMSSYRDLQAFLSSEIQQFQNNEAPISRHLQTLANEPKNLKALLRFMAQTMKDYEEL